MALNQKTPVLVARKGSSSVRTVMICVLNIVKSLVVGLPHINSCILDWLPCQVANFADDKKWVSLRISQDVGTIGNIFRFVSVEWS